MEAKCFVSIDLNTVKTHMRPFSFVKKDLRLVNWATVPKFADLKICWAWVWTPELTVFPVGQCGDIQDSELRLMTLGTNFILCV